MDLTTSRIYTTRHAQFDEGVFPYVGELPTVNQASLIFSSYSKLSMPILTTPQTNPMTAAPASQLPTVAPGCCSLCLDSVVGHDCQ